MTESNDIRPLAAIRLFVEAFNSADVDLVLAACADETTIIDDFPPYRWAGPGATARWFRDMAGMAATYGMSDPSVALDEPRMVSVSDRGAYVVVPVDVRWLQDGTPAQRPGFMTVALAEEAEGWRISALAWTWA